MGKRGPSLHLVVSNPSKKCLALFSGEGTKKVPKVPWRLLFGFVFDKERERERKSWRFQELQNLACFKFQIRFPQILVWSWILLESSISETVGPCCSLIRLFHLKCLPGNIATIDNLLLFLHETLQVYHEKSLAIPMWTNVTYVLLFGYPGYIPHFPPENSPLLASFFCFCTSILQGNQGKRGDIREWVVTSFLGMDFDFHHHWSREKGNQKSLQISLHTWTHRTQCHPQVRVVPRKVYSNFARIFQILPAKHEDNQGGYQCWLTKEPPWVFFWNLSRSYEKIC